MLLWSSEFPTRGEAQVEEVLGVAKTWVIGSPHSPWAESDVSAQAVNEVLSVGKEGHKVDYGHVSEDGNSWVGLRWRHRDRVEREWSTQVVASDHGGTVKAAIRVECHFTNPRVSRPRAKKPYLVRQILEEVGGGSDGPFRVQDQPHLLQEREVPVATSLVLGNAGNSLPVLYFSAARSQHVNVDPTRAARWFSGMAHVVVEPSRPFSFTLARETDGRNVYNGAIGILWPGGSGRTARFFPDDFDDMKSLGFAIGDTLTQALNSLQPTSHCTWAALAERVSKQQLERLKAAGSTEVKAYVEAFDGEIAAKDERLQGLERELMRLRNEISILEAQVDGTTGSVPLAAGSESPLFPGEIEETLVGALDKSLNYFADGTRPRHIVEDLLERNRIETPNGQELRNALGEALGSYRSFGREQRRALGELGFSVSEDGKHVKLVFRDDPRYTFTVAKTPSDHRSGKNSASQISRVLFP